MDKRATIALTIAGSLGALGIGYVIWRHEATLAAATAAAQQQAQQAATAQQAYDYSQIAAMEQQAYAGYGSSYGSTYNDYSQVQGTTLQSVPADTNLQTILSAFFGSQGSTATTTSSPSGASDSNTTTAATATSSAQIGNIPRSLLGVVTGINQNQASNPLITSQVGAKSGDARAAVDASHTLVTVQGAT